MDKFWEHFEKKTGFVKILWMDQNRENWKINIIGHIMEYLIEKEIHFDIANCYIERINTSGRSVAIYKTRKITIEDIYKYLEDKIDEQHTRL